jgi:hypothetical protein
MLHWGMNFLNIHEISVEFDIPSRVVRYRFHQLRQANKLAENTDFLREDFVDDQHFVWKINPVSFMRETGLKPVTKANASVNELSSKQTTADTKVVNQPAPLVDQPRADGNKVGSQTENKIAPSAATPTVEREMLDFLKGQIKVKDSQIADLTDQNKKVNDLNLKLVGQTVQQAEQIQTLLRLTGGKSEPDAVVAKEGEALSTDGNKVDNKEPGARNQTGNEHVTKTNATGENVGSQTTSKESGQGRPLAA